MKPSTILRNYLLAAFAIGVLLSIPTAVWLSTDELGARGAALMTLCWNVLFTMILPLVLDWSERVHGKVRFLEFEEVAATNPELAAAISDQCKRLAIPRLRLAVADTPADEMLSYGLWGHNPRLILPDRLLKEREKAVIIPSLEAELSRFTSQDTTVVFLLFTVVQVLFQQCIVSLS